MKRFRGFSLVELLIVMALTTLMLTIIFVPFTQSVRMLITGQGEVGLQSEVKNVTNLISKDVSRAVKITKTDGMTKFTVPTSLGSKQAQTRAFLSCFIDLWLPEQGIGKGRLRNSRIDKIDPTLKSQEGKEVLPLQSASRLVRYFISLKDPHQPYNIKKGNLLIKANNREDNPFVVYRTEIGKEEWDQYFKGEDPELLENPSQMDQDYIKRKWKNSWSKVSRIVHRVNQFDAIEISEKKDGKGNKFSPLVQFYFLPLTSIEKKEALANEIEYKGEETPVIQEYFSPFSLTGQNYDSYVKSYEETLFIENFKDEVLRTKEVKGLLDILKSTTNPNERYLCMFLIDGSDNNPLNISFSDYGKRYWPLKLEKNQVIVPGTDRLWHGDKILTRVMKDPIKPGQYKIRYTESEISSEDVFTADVNDVGYKNLLLDVCIHPQYKAGFIEFCPDPTFPLKEGKYTFAAQVVDKVPSTLQNKETYISGEGIKIIFGLSHYAESNMKRPQIFSMQRIVELKNVL